MMTFRTETAPSGVDRSLAGWLDRQFQNIFKAANSSVDYVYLRTLNAQPTRVFDGMTVLADGTNWDPGSGHGVYTYYAGAWHSLG
jgi:hypothetical protein